MWCPKCHTFNPASYRRCAKCRAPMIRRTSPLLVAGFAVVFLGALIGLGRLFSGGGGEVFTFTDSEATSASPSPEQPGSNVSIRRFNWRRGSPESVMIANFTIRNDNAYPVEDIGIECQVSAKGGAGAGYLEEKLRGPIPANSARDFADVAVGRIGDHVSRAGCRIKSAERGL